MPPKFLPLLILLPLLFLGQNVYAQSDGILPPAPEPVHLTAGQGWYPLGFHLEYLADPSYQLTIDEVTSPKYDAQFRPGRTEIQNFGYVKAAYWVRFQVQNETPENYQWLLEISPPFTDGLEVYHYSTGEPPQLYHLGDSYPFSQRGIDHRNFVLEFLLPPGSDHTFYARIVQSDRMIFDFYLWNPVTFLQYESYALLRFGLFYGIILSLMVYNLLLFVSVRDISHLYYAACAAAIALLFFAMDGFGFQYVWPNQIRWQNMATLAGLSAANMLIVLLTLDFFRFADLNKFWVRVMWGIVWVAAACSIGLLLAPQIFLLRVSIPVLSLVIQSVLLIVGGKAWWQGYKPARYYLGTWGVYLTVGFVPLLTLFAWLPANYFTQNMSRIAFAPAMVLLSLALADRINILKAEKEAAQTHALDIALENERLVQEQNITLEKLVAERTEALVEANQAKSIFLANISHELRTPLGLVEAAVNTLRSRRLELDETTRSFSLDTIADETRQLTGMVDNLLTASRLEQQPMKLSLSRTEVAAWLRDILVAWQTNFPQRQFNLHPPAEPVWLMLDPVQMQLVLRNLLQNAVKYSPPDTAIAVTLTATDEAVVLAVQDQGYGIFPIDQPHVFERFYRGDPELTHTIRGAGLGLAICQEIVTAHGGRIWLESQVDQGSTFYVQLPVHPPGPKE